jgi:hypothetical protein
MRCHGAEQLVDALSWRASCFRHCKIDEKREPAGHWII